MQEHNNSEYISVNINSMPKYAEDRMCRTILAGVKEYFKDPKVQENYKIWLEKRKAEGIS